MLLGVDYYPEQWPLELLEEDLDQIRQLGCNVIRIGEFAWKLMEPQEGVYDFSFFDHVISRAKERGLKIIFGTPTATPPAWLAARWPEVLSHFEDGTSRAFGGRHVCCYSSPVYREYCSRIVTKLAEHYREEPAIIAWQLDNELSHEGSDLCWCGNCRDRFRQWLHDRFEGDIQRLNEAFGTVFWGQQYGDFGEIPLPSSTITTHNPALRLCWEQFRAFLLEDFISQQAQLVRRVIPQAKILHDFPGGGLGKHADFAAMAQCLDQAAYNNYPVWGGQKEPLPPHEIAFGLDYIRGLRRQNFMITEAIMGAQGHDITGYLPRPGQAKLWSWQGMAHGCDSLLYFRYRGAAAGAEQFCYGLLDPDNIPRRRFREAGDFFRDVKEYEDVLTAPISSPICILYDFDSLASFRIQRQSLLLNCEREMKELYRVFFRTNQMVDIIPSREDFSSYKIVVVPNMIVTDKEFLTRLKEYVAAGGCAVVTYRTSVKDRNNNLVFGKVLPVDCDDLLGVTVEETESVQEYDLFPLRGADGQTGSAGIFRDMLQPTTAQVLYRYDDPFYQNYAAVTMNPWGRGRAYYLGTSLERKLLEEVLREAMSFAQLTPVETPDGVEAVVRKGEKRTVRFLLNHNPFPVSALGHELEAFEVLGEELT